jgi:glucose/arabinose dehydrogenase
VATGLRHPWGLAFLPDGDLLVTEKRGAMYRVQRADGRLVPINGIPADIYVGRQSGLHDVALHPDFARNSYVFLSYAAGDERQNVPRLMRYRLVDDRLVDGQVIYEPVPPRAGPSHSGNRILVHRDGTVLFSVGHVLDFNDVGRQAQDPTNAYGAVIRIRADGTIPAANPFATDPQRRPEIYTFGHRNVQGLAQRPGSEQVWAVEHGPKGGDELNLLRPGGNYGWPAITYGVDYDGTPVSALRRQAGLQQPVWYWLPSIAPSSAEFYAGDLFTEWRGDLFVTALRGKQLQRLELEGDHVIGIEVLLADQGERFRRVQAGPDGCLYLLTDSPDGRVLRLAPEPQP